MHRRIPGGESISIPHIIGVAKHFLGSDEHFFLLPYFLRYQPQRVPFQLYKSLVIECLGISVNLHKKGLTTGEPFAYLMASLLYLQLSLSSIFC